jgi:uridine kinase
MADTPQNVGLAEKVDTFKRELEAMVAADQALPVPAFQKVKIEPIVTSVKNFLKRQSTVQDRPVPFMMAIAGGSNSGKTTLLHELKSMLRAEATEQFNWNHDTNGPVVDLLELDNYYRHYADKRAEMGDAAFFLQTNLDEPNALLWQKSRRALFRIKNGKASRAPVYDFRISGRNDAVSLKTPSPFFMYEGLFALAHKSVRNLADLKIFVNCDAKTRSDRFWARAPQRNIKPDQGGWNLYNKAMGMHDLHVQPTLDHADLVINGALAKAELDRRIKPLVSLLVKTLYPQPAHHSDVVEEGGAKAVQAKIKSAVTQLYRQLKEATGGS